MTNEPTELGTCDYNVVGYLGTEPHPRRTSCINWRPVDPQPTDAVTPKTPSPDPTPSPTPKERTK